MKIALGINTFPTDLNRFKLAEASYWHLQKKGLADVFDIQHAGEQGKFEKIDTIKRKC